MSEDKISTKTMVGHFASHPKEDMGLGIPAGFPFKPLVYSHPDPVNHPAHYTMGRIEVIEAIEDWSLPYHLGNAVKYIARAGRKDKSKEIEDLKKARWYLDRYISKKETSDE